MILYNGWGLLKDAVLILMNATPTGMDVEAIRKAIEAVDGVKEIHHLHVWNPSAESVALAVHITVSDQLLSHVDEIAGRVRWLLLDEFKINHPILQFEANGCETGDLLCCPAEPEHKEF